MVARSPMAKFRDILVSLSLASAAEALAFYILAPELMLAENFSRSILRLFLINVAIYCSYSVFIYPFALSPLRKLPGPKGGSWLYGHAYAQFSKPPGEEMLHWVQSVPNEGLLRFRTVFNIERLVPTSPEALKAVMGDRTYDYEKPSPVRNFLMRILGGGLILVEGNEHRFQRKHLLPAFHTKQIRQLYPVFWEKSRSMVEGIEEELAEHGPYTVIEFGEWATRVTLDIIGVAGMGRDFKALKNPDDELVKNYNELLEPTREKAIYFAANIIFPMWLIKLLPWKPNYDLQRITTGLKSYAMQLVHERQKDINEKRGLENTDILTLLVKSNDFKDTELCDQLLTFLAAGHETTSSAVTWVSYLMAKHPDYQQRLRDEIRESLPSIRTLETPSSADIEALPFLNAVCNETLRLYPTVPITVREAVRASAIPVRSATGTYQQPIPKGTPVLLVPWAINRSPQIWGEDAGAFRPERWLGEGRAGNAGQASNYAQITFLHGARSCIGQGFAKAELKCLVAALVGRFHIEMADPHEDVYPAGVITTKPVNGMHLRMKPLEGW